jgi:hypothetical protein
MNPQLLRATSSGNDSHGQWRIGSCYLAGHVIGVAPIRGES